MSIFDRFKRNQETETPVDGGVVENASTVNDPEGVQNGFNVLAAVIGEEQVRAATQTLQDYKRGKANLEQKIVDNQKWYRVRHWECMRDKKTDIQPSSAWLFNAIANKHADAMDNFPSPNILPREEGDKGEAELLTSIVPVLLDECDFETVYSRVWNYKLITGTGVYGIFWDKEKLNGLGDVSIQKIDLLNLFWEPGITDIQRSRNVFNVELRDNDLLIDQYPQLKGRLGTSSVQITQYAYDDTVDTSNKSAVVDWYYKKRQNGKTVLHYCKYVNDIVLYATENERQPIMNEMGQPVGAPPAETGLYAHGKYPFVFDPLFDLEGSPAGFGYIDVAKDCQAYIDRCGQIVLDNMLKQGRVRYFVREDGGVNEAEYADFTKDFVHVSGGLGQDSIVPTQTKSLDGVYMNILEGKIEELKEVTGNRDVMTGGTTGGATAASAVAAMQEAGSRLSRDHNKSAYRAFREIVVLVIELIRQFYDMPRTFRIVGENGTIRFQQLSNEHLLPQPQGGVEFGVDTGYRLPQFDIEVTAEKQSPYSKMSQNELALQFYSAGFFNPAIADQALACLDMMDFDRKQFVMQKIAENGGMYQQMLQMQEQMMMLAQMVDQSRGSNLAEQLAAQFSGQAGTVAPIDGSAPSMPDEKAGEAKNTRDARKRVAESTSPT